MQCAQLAKDLYKYGFQFAFWVNWGPEREQFWDHYKDGVYIRFVSGVELQRVERFLAKAPDNLRVQDYPTLPGLEKYTFTFWKVTSPEEAARRDMIWVNGAAYEVTEKDVVITEWPDFTQMLGCMRFEGPFEMLMRYFYGKGSTYRSHRPKKNFEEVRGKDGFYGCTYELL